MVIESDSKVIRRHGQRTANGSVHVSLFDGLSNINTEADSTDSDISSSSPEDAQPTTALQIGIFRRFRVTLLFIVSSLVAISIVTSVVVNTTRDLATENFMTDMESDAVAHIQHLVHSLRDDAPGRQAFDASGNPIPHETANSGYEDTDKAFTIDEISALGALPAQITWAQEDLDFIDAFIFNMDGELLWGTSEESHDTRIEVNHEFASAASGIADSELEIETINAGTAQERNIYVSEVYLPLYSVPGGSIIGITELYTDVTDEYFNLVTNSINGARTTALLAMGALFTILAGFVVTADIFRAKAHQRELAQEQVLAAASRTVASELRSRIAVLDAAADMILITEPDGTIQYANTAFQKNTGYTAEEVIGKSTRLLKSGRQDSDFYKSLWDDVSSGRVWSGTLINRRKDGTEYPEDMTITPILGDNGEVLRFIAIKRDITERLQFEAERDAARDLESQHHELLRVNEARKEFLTTVSHELRTPLTSMLAFSDVLRHNRDENLTERQLNQLQLISNGGRRLNDLIGDLLDVSRTETGRFALEVARFDVQETIGEVALSMRSVFDGRDQKLKLTNLSDTTYMDGDRSRVMQVFNNLLTNSAKYSPNGTLVEMDASIDKDVLQVTIRDHGIGISTEDQQQLFIPFYRVSNEETRKESGTGLGLSIVKTIVEMHGGRVELESEPGDGTTVRIWLPGVLEGSFPVGY